MSDETTKEPETVAKEGEEIVAPTKPRANPTELAKAANETALKALESAEGARVAAEAAVKGVESIGQSVDRLAQMMATMMASQSGAPAPPPVRNVSNEDIQSLVDRFTADDADAFAKALRNKALVKEYESKGYNPFTQVIAKGRTKTRYKNAIIETIVNEPYDIDGFTPKDFEHLKANGVFDPPKLG